MIFDEQISRKPILYKWCTLAMQAMQDNPWNDREFTFSSDVQDFHTRLTEQEREIIIRALSAIGQIEVAVKTFWAKLGENIPRPEFVDLGYVMASVETTHNAAYERLLSVLDMEQIFEENLKLDFIEGRVKYLKKYTHKYYKDNKKQYLYALILFTLFVENVSLFSQFYIVKWFGKNMNVLKDTNQQVDYTVLEETVHALVGIKIINEIRNEYPDFFDQELTDRIISECHSAFEAESKIVDWMVNGLESDTLNAKLLKEFIKNRINESMKMIGFPEVFEIDNELIKKTTWFDEIVQGNTMTDFFNSRPVEYAKNTQTFTEDDLF